MVLLSSCAARDQGGVIEVDGTLAGRPLDGITADAPVALYHEQLAELSLTMTNRSSAPVTVAHVRLEGELLDLIFLTYDTGVRETIPPGGQRTVVFPLDLFDLRGQVHGLLRAQLRLYDAERRPLATRHLVVDGRGSPWATTSTFNLVLAGVAAVSLGWNLWRLANRRLPANRFSRGLRFLHTGIAAGLALAAASSTLRVAPLATIGWVMVAVVVAAVAFAAGYLSPGPLERGREGERPDGDATADRPDEVIDLDRPLVSSTGSGRVLLEDDGSTAAPAPAPTTTGPDQVI